MPHAETGGDQYSTGQQEGRTMIGNRIETNISGGLDVSLPAMVPVKVAFENRRVEDIAKTVAEPWLPMAGKMNGSAPSALI